MLLRALLLMLLLPAMTLAQGLPAQRSDAVNDFAHLLPAETAGRIAAALKSARDETGIQVVLVTLDSLAAGGGAGQPIKDYATNLFNTWAVGGAERNDGILILVARNDRMMRIALGAGYDPGWDKVAQQVIDQSFLPSFREDRYPEGIERGVAATVAQIARPFGLHLPLPGLRDDGWKVLAPIALIAVFVATALVRIGWPQAEEVVTRLRPCPECGVRSLRLSREVTEAATDRGAGHGVRHTRCQSCGWSQSMPFILAELSRDRPGSGDRDPSDRGSSGGGSSGGGASGKW